MIGFWAGNTLAGPPSFPAEKSCTTCELIDCTIDMTFDPANWITDPPVGDICSGQPIPVSRDCAAGACYGDGTEAGSSADLASLGACVGPSGGGTLFNAGSSTIPNDDRGLVPCKVNTPEICQYIDASDGYANAYCHNGDINYMLTEVLKCDGQAVQGSSGYTCCDGIASCACFDAGSKRLCTDCSSGTYVTFTESRGPGDQSNELHSQSKAGKTVKPPLGLKCRSPQTQHSQHGKQSEARPTSLTHSPTPTKSRPDSNTPRSSLNSHTA